MSAPIPLAVLAGVLSVLLNFSLLTGTFASVLLTYLTPLPLFMAGLGLGFSGAVTASITGTVLVVAAGFAPGIEPLAAVHYVVVFVIPVCLLTRQAMLSRQASDGSVEWYPPGLLLTWLVALAAAYLIVAMAAIVVAGAAPSVFLDEFVATLLQQLEVDAVPEMAGMLASNLPLIFALSWMLLIIANGCLAQALLARFKRNLRPSDNLTDIDLPQPLLMLFAAALLAAFFSGTLGLVGKTLAAIIAVPYFLLGLGFIHRQVRQWAWRAVALVALYSLIFLLFPLGPLVIVAVGLFEQAGRLRRRGGGGRKEE